MSFNSYKSIDEVARKYRVRIRSGPVIPPAADSPKFSAAFLAELEFNLTYLRPTQSEFGAGEVLLFPILREIWKTYYETLNLITHEALDFDDDLCGFPDYYVCRVSELGRIIEVPYLLVAEAKLDDFEKAWAQCLAAMLAAQKLNGTTELPIYGMASNGQSWQFGKLDGQEFTRQLGGYTVSDADSLAAMMHAVFRACRDQALAYQPATAAA
jgi:hypothetical protein